MKAELIIPVKDNDGSDNAEIVETAIREMCAKFGGCTVFEANGFWSNDEGKLYNDPVKVIVASVTSDVDQEIQELASLVLDSTDQEAVFYSVDGKASIIKK